MKRACRPVLSAPISVVTDQEAIREHIKNQEADDTRLEQSNLWR
jgi:hypothetical protein